LEKDLRNLGMVKWGGKKGTRTGWLEKVFGAG
jgi:hypothetical protein